MAVKWLPLVHEGTSTSGTGALTLDGTPPADRRSFATAQANSEIAASGDEVYFMVSDLAAGGTNWELNRGTWTAAGNTLTRTNPPIKSSNGGALVNFPGGGKRDVLTVVDPILFALLGVAQNFTALQTFIAGLSSSEAVAISKAAAAANFGALALTNAAAANLSNSVSQTAILQSGSGAVTALRILTTLTNIGAGTESSRINFQALNASASLSTIFRINAGQLEDGAGVAYAKTGVLSAPSGTNLFFPLQSTVPTLWSKNTSHNDAALRVVSGTVTPTGGTRGLSSASVGGTVITIGQMPSHTHEVKADETVMAAGADTPRSRVLDYSVGGLVDSTTSSAGSDQSHDHALALKYVDGVIGTKT